MSDSVGNRKFRQVPVGVVERIEQGLAGKTNAALTSEFGISYNTWRKILAGEAVRERLAERLEQRVMGHAQP